MFKYNSASPYSKTTVRGDYLDIMDPRLVLYDETDQYYKIEPKYHMRPDLLSYAKYGTVQYWWIFTQRNKNILIDPIQDFKSGTSIRIPKLKNIR